MDREQVEDLKRQTRTIEKSADILVKKGEGGKEISQVDKDGFLFLIAEFLCIAFWLSIGVSWGIVSMQFNGIHLITTFFTWLFWIVGIVGLFIYTPYMCWWAYKKGVWA